MSRITLLDLMYISYYKIPKELVRDSRFEKISIGAKLLYGVMVDRTELSKVNNWINQNGEIFIYYKLEEIQKDLNISRQTAVNYLNELVENELLEKEKKDFNKPNKYYLLSIVQKVDNNSLKNRQQKSKNHTTIVYKLDTNNNEYNNNEYNNNNLIDIKLYNNFDENVECDCICQSTNEKCQRRSTYQINEKNYCNQHSREIISKHLSYKNTKKKYFEDNELNELFLEFLDLRKTLKAKNTDRAINLLLNDLNKVEDKHKLLMLQNSIKNSWKSIYPLKKEELEQLKPKKKKIYFN